MSDLSALAFSVLMVGHSLFGQTGPDMFSSALSARVGTVEVQAQIINGAPLKYNWEHSAEAAGVDARAVLPRGGMTHLILTEALPLANHVQWSDTATYAMSFAGLALDANPEARIYVQETWHSLNSGTGAPVAHDAGADIPWRDRLAQDLPVWEAIVSDLRRATPAAADRIGLIPAGQAMARLADEIDAGRVPGLSGIEALFDDDIHPTATGHYFVSMVQYASLTGDDPQGLPHVVKDRWGTPLDGPDATLAATLQRIAYETVQAYTGPRAQPVTFLHKTATRASDSADMAIGLASVTDWSPQQPFLDVMKTARPWIGHRPGQWGGVKAADLAAAGHLDPDGWPRLVPPGLGSIGTLILTDMPEAATDLAGRYRLRFEGEGIVEVSGRARGPRYGPGEVRFDYTPGSGSVDIRIQRSNPANPVRNLTVVREPFTQAFDNGARFNPDWLARLQGFDTLRFMDWMETNDSSQSDWAARPRPDQATWAGGVPLEIMIDLANTTRTDPWFNMPHLADDAYIRAFATEVKARLDPGLTAYVEFSNEVWNWQFAQTAWADEQARALWGVPEKGMQFYGKRAAEVARIWTDVFGAEAPARLVNVISSQTGWLGLETEVLDAPLLVASGGTPPAQAFDAYAVTGYFGGIIGTQDRAPLVRRWLAQGRDTATGLAGRALLDGTGMGDATDTVADLVDRVWPYHAGVARRHGLDLIMYEGGSHVVGIGPMVEDADLTAFFQHLNYSAEMGYLYAALIEGWRASGGQLFNAYSDVYAPSKWGSWGALRHLSDDNPRWQALVAAQ